MNNNQKKRLNRLFRVSPYVKEAIKSRKEQINSLDSDGLNAFISSLESEYIVKKVRDKIKDYTIEYYDENNQLQIVHRKSKSGAYGLFRRLTKQPVKRAKITINYNGRTQSKLLDAIG